jgi:secondary thiamine-phosphate synthase enzyme
LPASRERRHVDGSLMGEDAAADGVCGCYRRGEEAGGGFGRGRGRLLRVCASYDRRVVINEHFDPDVARDLEGVFERLVPRAGAYRHAEGNSDSHAKAILTGASQMIFVEEGKLVLGQWQGVFFCEFDGPRERKLWIKILA